MSEVSHEIVSFEQRLRKVPFSGILFALISSITAAFPNFTVKLLPEIHAVEIVVIRPVSGKSERWPLIASGFFGFVAFSAGYMCFRYIPFGDGTAIMFSAPVYVSIFSVVLLTEPFALGQFILLCLTMSGVLLISKPTFIFGTETGDVIYGYEARFTVKLLPEIHPVEIVVIRSIIQLFVCIIIIVVTQSPVKGEGERWPLFIRSFFGFIAYVTSFTAVQLIPFGDAVAIVFSAPVYVSIFACLLLGEAFGIVQFVFMAITMSGIMFISKPTFIFGSKMGDNIYPPDGYVLAFAASISITLTYVNMRKLQKTPSSVVLAWFSFLSAILGVISLAVLHFALGKTVKCPTHFSSSEWLYLVGNGLCGVASQLCLTLALKVEEAGLVSLTRCSDIVLGYVFQVIFLTEKLQWTSILGAAIVLLGVALTCIRKIILQRKTNKEREVKANIALLER
ncbi:Solute carrier family 35 member G1 [Halotydeus destructor]|nr:Solute carrier family 35 member G1 [Halotydeus destructor]